MHSGLGAEQGFEKLQNRRLHPWRIAWRQHPAGQYVVGVVLGVGQGQQLLVRRAEAGEGLHQASLIYLGLVLFFITFVVLSLSKLLLSRLKKSEGARS